MLKIIHIIPSLCKGGAERLALDICIELAESKGVEIRLITFSNINDYEFLSKNIQYKEIPCRVIPSLSGKSVVEINELIKYILEFKPDIIHSHLFEAEIVSRWNILPNIKYFTHCHDNMPQLRRFKLSDIFYKKRLTELFERWLLLKRYKTCHNQFITISNDTKVFLEQNIGNTLKKNIILMHNAINCNRFQVDRVETEKLYLVNVGSFVPKKNQKFFIPLAKDLIKKGLEFKIILLGDGLLKNEFIAEMKKNQLEKYFELPGNINNVEDYYAKSKIYIHAALYEPFGLVLLEAMAAGLPVICLDGKGNRDIIEDGKNGFILYNQNVANFSGKIIQLIENKELYQAMSSYAKEYAKKYDIKDYVDKLLDMYKKSMK